MGLRSCNALSEDEIFRVTVHTFDDVSILAYLEYCDQRTFSQKIQKSLDAVGLNLEPENVITIKWFLKKLGEGEYAVIETKNKKVKNAFKDLLSWEQRILKTRFRPTPATNTHRENLENITRIIRKII